MNLFSRNVSWLAAERLVRLAFGLIIGAWVARHLGPENYGALTFFITNVAIATTLINFGFDIIAVKEMAQNPTQAHSIVSNLLLVRLSLGLILILIALGLATTRIAEVSTSELFSFVVVCIFLPYEVIDLYFQAHHQNALSVRARLYAFMISNALKAIAIYLKMGLSVFIVLFGFDYLYTAFFLLASYRAQANSFSLRFNAKLVKLMLFTALPYLLNQLSTIIYMRLDQFFILRDLDKQSLGFFSVALLFSQFWYFLPVVIFTSIMPQLATAKKNSETEYTRLVRRFVYGMYAFSIATISFNLIISPYAIQLLYGSAYASAIPIMKIYSFSILPVSLGMVANAIIANDERHIVLVYRSLSTIAVAFVANLLLIPRYGLTGAAVATLITQSYVSVASNMFFYPRAFRLQILLKHHA